MPGASCRRTGSATRWNSFQPLFMRHGSDQPPGEGDAAGRDPEQDEVVGALVALEDLVGDPAEDPRDVAGGEHLTRGRDAHVTVGFFGPSWLDSGHHLTSFPASQDGG